VDDVISTIGFWHFGSGYLPMGPKHKREVFRSSF